MKGWLASLVGFLLTLLALTPAMAHEVRPALLQITQTAPDHYDVLWKRPILGDVALRLKPHLSSGWLERPPADQFAGAGFLVTTWRIRASEPLDRQELAIEGLDQSLTDVLLQVSAEGRRIDTVIKPERPRIRLELAQAAAPGVPAYLRLGVEHILGGIDHLMFVLGLLLLVGPNRHLIKAVTAFTLAHSVTLAAAALGWVTVPSAVVEALVALSIVFVALELVRPPEVRSLTRSHPWLVALVFGLLHGFAFAGALAEIGLPPNEAAPALLLFNLGVEIGQLVFVAIAIVAIWLLARLRERTGFDLPAVRRLGPAYAIGCFSAFWFLERMAAAFA